MLKKQVAIIALSSLVLVGAGCGRSVSQFAADKAAEKIVESQTGGQVKLDSTSGNVKIKSENGGTFESGENLSLPDSFPKDVFVAEGKIVSAVSDPTKETFSISIQAEQSYEDLYAAYQDKFKSDGWKITGTMQYGDTATVIAEKGDRQASVMVAKSDGKTSVIITTGKK